MSVCLSVCLSLVGDGVAAFLQGIALNRMAWQYSTLSTKTHLLQSVSGFLASAEEQLLASVGVQHTVDLLRCFLAGTSSVLAQY